jgi:protein-S-isoprenylcysteine O-methyltransferase Ste14
LIAGLFAIAVPPADLFGSEMIEHIKDSCAIVIALAGLTVRGLVVGFRTSSGAAPNSIVSPLQSEDEGPFSLCRHPLYAGNILICTGIFLMHGNEWTVLFGTLTYVLLHAAIVRAEEAHLLQAFGSAYEDYSRRNPRWLPRRASWKQVTRGLRFDFHSALTGEYPVIGLTVIALAAANFYEEIEKPLVGGQALISCSWER